jgi:hypothetical protein
LLAAAATMAGKRGSGCHDQANFAAEITPKELALTLALLLVLASSMVLITVIV